MLHFNEEDNLVYVWVCFCFSFFLRGIKYPHIFVDILCLLSVSSCLWMIRSHNPSEDSYCCYCYCCCCCCGCGCGCYFRSYPSCFGGNWSMRGYWNQITTVPCRRILRHRTRNNCDSLRRLLVRGEDRLLRRESPYRDRNILTLRPPPTAVVVLVKIGLIDRWGQDHPGTIHPRGKACCLRLVWIERSEKRNTKN